MVEFSEPHEPYLRSVLDGYKSDEAEGKGGDNGGTTADYRYVGTEEMKREFPFLDHGGKNFVACVDNLAGVLYSDRCLEALRV